MGDSKGKGRARHDEDERQSHAHESSQEPSMLSKVAASASGLARSTFASPTHTEINEQAETAISTTGKGAQSSRNGGDQAEASRLNQNPTPRTFEATGLRSVHREEHIKQAENEFSHFLDGIDAFSASEDSTRRQTSNDSLGAAWSRAANHDIPPVSNRTITEQEEQDGQEVIALLSDPSIDKEDFEQAQEEDKTFDWGLSAEQLSQLKDITKELFPPLEPRREVSIDNQLNLMPKLGRLDEKSTADLMGHGIVSPVDRWREQWQGVLTGYTDEVWGNLLPLIKQVRNEVTDKDKVPQIGKSNALRRLEAILGHLQRS